MKKFIKHSFIFIFLLSVLFSPISVYANDTILSSQKEYLENGDYFEITTIEHDTNSFFATSKTITASRTAKYVTSSGKVCWSVTVTVTFTYNGSTSKCTASKVSAISNNSNWRIASKNSSRSGNTASATATANLYKGSKIIKTATKTVTLSCSKNGTLS
mgnify:CR=1 FL=1